jgi:hypothetical protein
VRCQFSRVQQNVQLEANLCQFFKSEIWEEEVCATGEIDMRFPNLGTRRRQVVSYRHKKEASGQLQALEGGKWSATGTRRRLVVSYRH